MNLAKQPWNADVVLSTTERGGSGLHCHLFHHCIPKLSRKEDFPSFQGLPCVNDEKYYRIPIQKKASHNNIYLAIESAIQQNLHQLTQGKTALIIAHRLSTIRHADKIIVLKDGQISESGTHEDLLAINGIYADLWKVQIGELVTQTE